MKMQKFNQRYLGAHPKYLPLGTSRNDVDKSYASDHPCL